MKVSFVIGVLLGFCGLLAAAHYWPFLEYERVPAQTSVVANGGRAETFVIRLPADRLSAVGSPDAGMRASTRPGSPADAVATPALGGAPVLVEHFKLRNGAGNVIGIAARHWTRTATGQGAAWSLLIPGRGALYLAAPGEARGAVDAALRAAGHTPGREWNGHVAVTLAQADAGAVVAGSAEFDGFRGNYGEEWKLTGSDASGGLRGTIELATVTFAAL